MKEHNEIYEMYGMVSRKQNKGGVWNSSMQNWSEWRQIVTWELGREIWFEMYSSSYAEQRRPEWVIQETQTPEEAIKIAVSYKRDNSYAKTYK